MLNDLKERLNLKENYVSMGLGLLVVLVVGNLIFNAVTDSGKEVDSDEPETAEEEQEATKSADKPDLPKKHTVKEGEDLWSISEKYYGSGYNVSDLVAANAIANPDRVEAGTELSIPDVKPKPAPGKVEYEEYTVRKGETLFDIAVKVYGDGYAYKTIAKANNLRNVNRIEVGQKLRIPR